MFIAGLLWKIFYLDINISPMQWLINMKDIITLAVESSCDESISQGMIIWNFLEKKRVKKKMKIRKNIL